MQNKEGKVFMISLLGLLVVGGLITFGVFGAGQNGTTLSASKTGSAHFTHTFGWTIEKSATPSVWELFRGDNGTSQYTIQVIKDDGTDQAWVDGQICVTNGGVEATENLTITDDLKLQPNTPVVTGQSIDVSSNPVLNPGETGCYNYRVDIPSPIPGGDYKNTAHITITNHSGWLPGGHNCPGTEPCAFGPSPSAPSADTILPEIPTLVNDTISVTDSNGGQFEWNNSGSVNYEKTFSCDQDQGDHANTATIDQTGQMASASVRVNCYTLRVQKDASTKFDRTHDWLVGKVADQSSLTLALNQVFPINYSVSTNIGATTDSNWKVQGAITITNPAPMPANITDVTDSVSAPELGPASIAAEVDCNTSLPFILPAGESRECSYAAGLPNADTRDNQAGVKITNYNFYSQLPPVASGSTAFISDPVQVSFISALINQIHPVVALVDSIKGALAEVSFSQQLPYVANYTSNIGPYSTCGVYNVHNVATVTPLDSGTTQDSAEWTININVPCQGGCTLTIGYWKTHAGFSEGRQRDMATPLLPKLLGTLSGAKTINVTTAQMAVQFLSFYGSNNVFSASNGINKLYAQLLAAKLNIASGANSSAVMSTITATDTFLATKNSLDWDNLTKAQKNQVLGWMTTLNDYNNGFTGPGHCSQ